MDIEINISEINTHNKQIEIDKTLQQIKIIDYEKIIINEPISGIVKYKTGVGLEALKIFEDTTKTVVDSALGSADGISNFLANALGIDPDLFKILLIIVCVIAAYIFLRPFISVVSMLIPSTGIGIGGGKSMGGISGGVCKKAGV